MLISLFPTPFDRSHFHGSTGLVPNGTVSYISQLIDDISTEVFTTSDNPSTKDVKCIEEGTGGACTDDLWAREYKGMCIIVCVPLQAQTQRNKYRNMQICE